MRFGDYLQADNLVQMEHSLSGRIGNSLGKFVTDCNKFNVVRPLQTLWLANWPKGTVFTTYTKMGLPVFHLTS